MAEAPPLLSADELLELPRGRYRYELLHGVLHRMTPPGAEHGWLAAEIIRHLGTHVHRHRLGWVCGEVGCLLKTDPDLVRAPDVAFLTTARIPEGQLPEKYVHGAPDLVVEVISPNDRYGDVLQKVADWLHYGARMVVLVEPNARRLVVYRPDQPPAALSPDDVFDGADVVPGFRLPVRELFTR